VDDAKNPTLQKTKGGESGSAAVAAARLGHHRRFLTHLSF
jgi:hypothetical protein